MNEINEIKLPKGVESISVTKHDDKIVIEFMPEKPENGDLAIFWIFDKTQAVVRLFDKEQGDIFQLPIYVDNTGHWWANAIKFESKEQFEKVLRGEI